MKAGLLYENTWATIGYSSINKQGWDLLLFVGIETIHRDDGVTIENYRFHDIIKNESVLMDRNLALKSKEIKSEDYHEHS